MNRPFKIAALLLLLIVGLFAWYWPAIEMRVASSAHYTEQEHDKYVYYTPEVLKTIPRISPDYSFTFSNISGPASHVYTMTFFGTDETNVLNGYLKLKGYKEEESCMVKGVCWRHLNAQETIVVAKLESQKAVQITVVYNF